MRELKFRVWDKTSEAWLNDKISIALSGAILFEWEPVNKALMWLEKELIFMQYTGLKDKNGKEIYEGDILEYPDSYVWTNEASIAEVIYWKSMRLEGVWIDCYIDYDSFKNCEIIGNIHENHNLLTK